MGSLKASFNITGKKYNALSAGYELNNNSSMASKEQPSFHGGIISVIFEVPQDIDIKEIFINDIDGQLVFYNPSNNAIIKQVDFRKATMIHYEEHFDNDDKAQFTIKLTFFVKVIVINNSLSDFHF
ncbi:MAG: hypothetical protein H9802_10355 [Candidatus Phocaeicola faecipullorum]|nr:hypothetical protein [Candidatus Phocaeicola faecipullorum]